MDRTTCIRKEIIEAYNKAFESGDGKSWRAYRNLLTRRAKELGAPPQALEDWAFRTAMMLDIRCN